MPFPAPSSLYRKLHHTNLIPTPSSLRRKFRLDDPWHNRLRLPMPITTSLIFLNTATIFILATINASSINIPKTQDDAFAANHTLLIRLESVFYWCTIPTVYLITTATENFCLWDNRLRPLYVVVAAVIAVNVWILQLTLWIPCVFSTKDGRLDGPPYCPYHLQGSAGLKMEEVQSIGTPGMPVYGIPSLFVLYFVYLAIGIIAMRDERKKPQRRHDTLSPGYLGKRSAYSSQPAGSSGEAIPFRSSWKEDARAEQSGSNTHRADSPASFVSPRTLMRTEGREIEDVGGEQEAEEGGPLSAFSDGHSTLRDLRVEPAIALMLTTPQGTTTREGEENPFDSDRLSRLGHRTH